MKDKINITVRPGGHRPFTLEGIPRESEEAIREAEYSVNRLWAEWCRRFSDRTPEEVMALVALQMARNVVLARAEQAHLVATLQELDSKLSRMVHTATDAAVMPPADGDSDLTPQ